MKKRIFKVILWVVLSLVLFLAVKGIWFLAKFTGEIPEMIDSNDGWYERVVNVQPTYGKIWYSGTGWRSTANYLRLHLSRTDFKKNFPTDSPLPDSQKPPLPSGPIWWQPDPNGRWFHSTGKFEEVWVIYDPRRELLYEKIDFW